MVCFGGGDEADEGDEQLCCICEYNVGIDKHCEFIEISGESKCEKETFND